MSYQKIAKEYAKTKGTTEYNNIKRIGKTKEDFTTKPIYAYDKKRRTKTLKKILHKTSGTLLDVGCSNGHYYPTFKELGFTNITGVDISNERLAIAKKRGYNTINARAQNMPFPNDSFDVITCIDMLVHVLQQRHREAAVRECARVLKPGGKLVFTVPSKKAHELRHKINRLVGVKRPFCEDYCRFATLNDALGWVENAGLRVARTKGILYQYPEAIAAFPPALSLMDSVLGSLRGLEEYGMVMFVEATK